MLIRPYRVNEEDFLNRLPVFAQYPNRFGVRSNSVFELNSYSLVDLTFSSEKSKLGEPVYMYSPACTAGGAYEHVVVFSNEKRSFESITKTYRRIFGSTESFFELCDESALKRACEKAAALYKDLEAFRWEDGPFIALNKRVKGSIDAASYGNYSGIYVLNMLRL